MKEGDHGQFREELSELKDRGAVVLVSATSRTAAVDMVSSQLLGDRASRVPVFLLIGRDPTLIEKRVDGPDQLSDAQILEFGTDFTRSSKMDSSADDPDNSPDRQLAAFGETVNTQLDTLAMGHDLGRSDLRICLDSLLTLLDSYSYSSVESFLTTLGEATRSHRGMTHVVCPGQVDGGLPNTLTSNFDIIVRVRGVGRDAQQCWELVQSDQTTEWVPVDSP